MDFHLNNLLMQYGILLPNSRKTELEADYVGLLLLSLACYDPNEAAQLWKRMDEYEKSHSNVPFQFMSTHPSHYSRIERIREWMPEAMQKRKESNCDQYDFWGRFRF